MTPLNNSLVIDFHVHAFPEHVAYSAISNWKDKTYLRSCLDGTVGALKRSMQQSGIAFSVLQPVATKSSQVKKINRWCSTLSRQEGLLTFGALHPDLTPEELDQEILFLQQHGIPGVKLHSEYQDFYADEDRMAWIYSELEKHDLILVLHSGMDVGFVPPMKATPRRILQVIKGFPKLRCVAAHLGGFRLWKDVERFLLGQPIWLDTAYCQTEFSSARLQEWLTAHELEKFLFASDSPWGDQQKHLQWLREANLSPEALSAIESKNTCKLLKLDVNLLKT